MPENAPDSESVTDRLDAVSRALSRAGGMAVAAGHFDLATLIGEAGCDLDDIIDDLLEAEGATADSAPASPSAPPAPGGASDA